MTGCGAGWWRSAKVLASHCHDPGSILGSARLDFGSHVRKLFPLLPGGFLALGYPFHPQKGQKKIVSKPKMGLPAKCRGT